MREEFKESLSRELKSNPNIVYDIVDLINEMKILTDWQTPGPYQGNEDNLFIGERPSRYRICLYDYNDLPEATLRFGKLDKWNGEILLQSVGSSENIKEIKKKVDEELKIKGYLLIGEDGE